MATGIDPQPLEFSDFSGGLTDNFLQGNTKRYSKADNFLITIDHKLKVRDGTKIYDPVGYSLGSSSRVNSLFTGVNESLLFATANRDIYTQKPGPDYGTAWSKILGPYGSEAISGGDNYSQITTGEFQRQIYFTSDEGVQPGKIFRDQTNTWKALTAGLPKMQWTPNYPNDTSLLAACIHLANRLRSAMIAHMEDNAGLPSGTSTSFQHKLPDKYSLSYLKTQSFSISDPEYPGPQPTPTPAPAATNQASLFALCLALSLAYEHHRRDLSGSDPTTQTGAKRLHQDIGTPELSSSVPDNIPNLLGISAKQTISGNLSSLQRAASFLDELATKFYWHQLSPYSHSPDNTYSLMSRYLLSANGNDSVKIGTIYSTPLTINIMPNYVDYAAYAYWIKKAWNTHAVGNSGDIANLYHGQIDPGYITLPDPVDFDSASLNIFWARWLYSANLHLADSNVATHTRVTFDASPGSADITNVVKTSDSSPLSLPVGSWVLMGTNFFDDTNVLSQGVAQVLSFPAPTAGTATLSKTITLGGSGNIGQYSNSRMHGVYVNGSLTTSGSDVTNHAAGVSESLSTSAASIGTSLSTWIALGTEFLLSLGAHELNSVSHQTSNIIKDDMQGIASINGNPWRIPTVVTYGYAAFYSYTYTVEPNGIIYLNEGAPVFSASIETLASYPIGTFFPSPNTSYFDVSGIVTSNPSTTIVNIPGLSNTTLTNYDTTVSVAPIPTIPGTVGYNEDFTIELYRTTNGGTTFFYLDSLTNVLPSQNYLDTTNESYPDSSTAALNLRKVMYTSGGVVANDQPPISKFIHTLGQFTYYGGITDTGQFFPQRIRQSLAGNPDSAPSTFFDDLEDEVMGISSVRNNLIALCKDSIYRVEGSFSSTGQGAMRHEKISDSMGCVNARSIVKTEIGVFYAGTDGFYYTDGYQVIKISLDLDTTYRSLTLSDNQKHRIYGGYDKLTRRIWWAMQSERTASDNDLFFVYYLDYGVKPSGIYTKSLTTDSWKPSSAVFFQGKLIIGDSRGYLFKSDSDTKTDPLVNVSISPTSWRTVYIPWNYLSCSIDFGTTFQRKWVTRIHSVGQNIGNVALQINTINDAGTSPDGSTSTKPLAPIQYLSNHIWGDATIVWGTSSYNWKYDGKMDVWRRFPSRSMRSDFKQVQYLPGSFVVYKYDLFPEFAFTAVNATLKTATITIPSTYTSIVWPLDVVDYYISFDTDNYAIQYLITSLDATKKIITYSDAANSSTTVAAAKWQISGIKKEQRMQVTSFVLHFGYLGDENEAYPGSSSAGGQGENV